MSTEAEKPKEFWIDSKMHAWTWLTQDEDQLNFTRVIEYSAVEELKADMQMLVDTLTSLREQMNWYENTFAHVPETEHEFAHWWRIEMPFEIDQAIEQYKARHGNGK